MTLYPPHLAVITADFHEVIEHDHGAERHVRHLYLAGFGLLEISHDGEHFSFREKRVIADDPSDSMNVLIALCEQFDPAVHLAGQRLDQTVGSLIRVPFGDAREIEAVQPLKRLRAMLQNEVVDIDWFADRPDDRTAAALAERFDLDADFGQRERELNPCRLEQMLSARAQAIWLSIATELLPDAELRQAITDYEIWRSAHSIA